jgi:hypothetical protein
MTIAHLHLDRGLLFAQRIVEFVYAISAFGVLGGLPPLFNIIARYARRTMTQRHSARPHTLLGQ